MSLIADFVKELRDYAIYLEDDLGNGKTCDLLRKSADTIEELSAKVARQNMDRSSQYYNGGWIPVEERLPEITEIGYNGTEMYSEDMLVALRWYDGDVVIETGWYNRNGKWSNDSKTCKVIAWQPLPPAYEPKED